MFILCAHKSLCLRNEEKDPFHINIYLWRLPLMAQKLVFWTTSSVYIGFLAFAYEITKGQCILPHTITDRGISSNTRWRVTSPWIGTVPNSRHWRFLTSFTWCLKTRKSSDSKRVSPGIRMETVCRCMMWYILPTSSCHGTLNNHNSRAFNVSESSLSAVERLLVRMVRSVSSKTLDISTTMFSHFAFSWLSSPKTQYIWV